MANNHYSLKDKKITIWSYTTQTIKGVTKKVYEREYSKIWSYYRHNGGNATLTGTSIKVYDENAAALFIINNRPVTVTWLIVYDHKIYEVTRVDNYENYNDDLKIYCKMASNQNFSAYEGLEDD